MQGEFYYLGKEFVDKKVFSPPPSKNKSGYAARKTHSIKSVNLVEKIIFFFFLSIDKKPLFILI